MSPILVTGGAKGLGRAICLELAAQGHSVVVHYDKSEKEAGLVVEECAKKGVEAQKVQGNFSSPQSVQTFLERYLNRFSHTKGIVNNVGNYLVASPSETKPQEWSALFQTNLFAPIALIESLLPHLKRERGCIVNIGTTGLIASRALIHATAYAATKSALWFYTRALAKELASSHVTVNMVSPGFLETAVDLEQAPELPMGRPGTVEEGARAVAFFFDPKNHYITGQNIEVAGGFGL